MNKFPYAAVLSVGVIAILWVLSAPNWFARGTLGRAMTELDIWAQIHLPYPVLTLLVAGIIVTGIAWFHRHAPDESGTGGLANRKR